jgi:hypothetical protein
MSINLFGDDFSTYLDVNQSQPWANAAINRCLLGVAAEMM